MFAIGPSLTLLDIVPMASAAVTAVVCMMVVASTVEAITMAGYGLRCRSHRRDGESDGHSHRRNILAHRGIVCASGAACDVKRLTLLGGADPVQRVHLATNKCKVLFALLLARRQKLRSRALESPRQVRP